MSLSLEKTSNKWFESRTDVDTLSMYLDYTMTTSQGVSRSVLFSNHVLLKMLSAVYDMIANEHGAGFLLSFFAMECNSDSKNFFLLLSMPFPER